MSCQVLPTPRWPKSLLLVLTLPLLYAPAAADQLPLRRVVLFNAGVGFFQHEGQVDGNQVVEMSFGASDINDLLQSLVAQDLGGGAVASVTYEARNPLNRALQDFSIDLTGSPTLADMLTQLRGCRVNVQCREAVEGTVVGVEVRRRQVGDQTVYSELVNVLTNQGIQSVDLDQIVAVKILDEKVDQQFQQALQLIGQSWRQDSKTVRIAFQGEGKRRVSVGYIRQCPVWKTSYRLVIDDQQSLLQGWAIAENTTDADWEQVRLTLVSGRPVSFVTELYEPLFTHRPKVMPELYSPVASRVYSRGYATPPRDAIADLGPYGYGGFGGGMGAMGGAGGPAMGGMGMGGMGGFGAGMGGMGMGGMGGLEGDASLQHAAGSTSRLSAEELAKSVLKGAAGEETGDLFQYDVTLPVSIAQDRSAMLNIINERVKAESLSIFNWDVHEKHPMNGVRLHNTTPLHWMQGPIAVFAGGTYAGDARMRDAAPGTARMISYALDLDIDVRRTVNESPPRMTDLVVANGVITATAVVTRRSSYWIDSTAEAVKQLIIEQQIEDPFELVSRSALEEASHDEYRFLLELKPRGQVTFVVEEQKTQQSESDLASLGDQQLQAYLSDAAVPEKAKSLLVQLDAKKKELALVDLDVEAKQQQITALNTWQSRVRENLKVLDKSEPLYAQYVQQLSKQETELEQLMRDVSELKTRRQQLDQELMTFLKTARSVDR